MGSESARSRVLSGMRPTGRLHLGHYHGVLRNWIALQHEYECYYFVADWHALTTSYGDTADIERHSFDMVVDWLAAGVSPTSAAIFIQSKVPEHAELHLLLSMITPVSWLERAPSYKDLQARLNDRELATYGFLGYPVLQAADILIYRAGQVPVGADQVAHVELSREIARRFNHLFGSEPGFDEHCQAAIKKMGRKAARLYVSLRKAYVEQGDAGAMERGRALLAEQRNLSIGDRERLFGYLEGGGRIILPEPEALLTEQPKVPGLDGEKMSKSYGNTIALREPPLEIERKVRGMKTDPARARRRDPGDPNNCPVFDLHRIYSAPSTQEWAAEGCRSAGIGCLDCKKPLIEAICAEQAAMTERGAQFEEQPDLVHRVLQEGAEKAREVAKETLDEVRACIGIAHK